MTVWVDADACPGAVRDLVVRAALRLGVRTVFVANKPLRLPLSPGLVAVQVAAGADVADSHIVRGSGKGDLAVTADIPLAAALVARGVVVIDPRGKLYDEDNIGDALSVRDLMHDLREGGAVTPGARPFGRKEAQQFASAFDRELQRALRREA